MMSPRRGLDDGGRGGEIPGRVCSVPVGIQSRDEEDIPLFAIIVGLEEGGAKVSLSTALRLPQSIIEGVGCLSGILEKPIPEIPESASHDPGPGRNAQTTFSLLEQMVPEPKGVSVAPLPLIM